MISAVTILRIFLYPVYVLPDVGVDAGLIKSRTVIATTDNPNDVGFLVWNEIGTYASVWLEINTISRDEVYLRGLDCLIIFSIFKEPNLLIVCSSLGLFIRYSYNIAWIITPKDSEGNQGSISPTF